MRIHDGVQCRDDDQYALECAFHVQQGMGQEPEITFIIYALEFHDDRGVDRA